MKSLVGGLPLRGSAVMIGGDHDFAVLLSGQSAAPAKNTNATELVERLAAETTQRLRVA